MKKWVSIILVLVLMSVGVFAEGKELTLDTSSVEDGAKDVSVMPEIELTFTNNVVNMKVKDDNMTMIEMKDSSDNSVAIIVEMADDQIQPDLKRIVNVKPESELKAGETYTLIIKKGFKSKTGSEIANDISIGFTTEGGSSSSSVLIVGVIAVLVIGLWFVVKRKNG